MNVYAALIISLFFYMPFVYLAVKKKHKKLGIELVIGAMFAMLVSVYCYHEPSIWTLYQRTWYWALACGFCLSALPYASLIMFINMVRGFKTDNLGA